MCILLWGDPRYRYDPINCRGIKKAMTGVRPILITRYIEANKKKVLLQIYGTYTSYIIKLLSVPKFLKILGLEIACGKGVYMVYDNKNQIQQLIISYHSIWKIKRMKVIQMPETAS